MMRREDALSRCSHSQIPCTRPHQALKAPKIISEQTRLIIVVVMSLREDSHGITAILIIQQPGTALAAAQS